MPSIVTAQEETPRLDITCAYSVTNDGNFKLDLPYDTLESAGFSITNMNIKASLARTFGIDSIEGNDLSTRATARLKANGLDDADIKGAKSHLSKSSTRRKVQTTHRRVADAA